ncbi:MAG TPA: hypothetical protein PK605_08480 [Ignavibacteria bacterium]|nr:hypothetical protein [Bacteroidota bacterium]HRF67142.1 hypothetical protein [Ignavibacteria bacterium]HRJ04424.1 hypothetical protein [Ignavibacteria bacterium]
MQFLIKIVIFLALANNFIYSQKNELDNLDLKLRLGYKEALFEIAPYLDSSKQVQEFLGYHLLFTKESDIAKRIIHENCIFTNDEILIDSNTSYTDFYSFLKINEDKITFSTYADAFLITSLEDREVDIKFRPLIYQRKLELNQKFDSLISLDWVKKSKVEEFIKTKNSECLKIIASELFKIRYRFDTYNNHESDFTNLLQILTNSEFAVKNHKNIFTWNVDNEFYPEASLNLLIYFSKNYNKFNWDTNKGYFVNDEVKYEFVSNVDSLFQLLKKSNSDSIAINAFIQLTECDKVEVARVSAEYEKLFLWNNYSIPTFPLRFLKQLNILVEYCKRNDVSYIGSERLKSYIFELSSELTFKDRRVLEDEIIDFLTLEEITSFEYWALIYQNKWYLTHSAGRILDIFYSRNWELLLNNEKYLKMYLIKSHLFDNLGITGVCNKYLIKFYNNGYLASSNIEKITEEDSILNIQKENALSFSNKQYTWPIDNKKISDANYDAEIENVKHLILSANQIKDEEKRERKIVNILSQINYDQIGEALNILDEVKLVDEYSNLYTFLESDYGFFIFYSFDSSLTRDNFRKKYDELSEKMLYMFMLDSAGVIYKKKNNDYDYDKIYQILKFNIVEAFVGGGGGLKNNEVYAVIKLLEFNFQTTLGYPKKLCNSDGVYGCDALDRAFEWMKFLVNNNLLIYAHKDPVSFKYILN